MFFKSIAWVCLTLFVLVGCSRGGRERVQLVPPVEVVAVERGEIRAVQFYSGSLEASTSFVLSPKVGGRLDEVGVDVGDVVEPGQVVARMEPGEYEQAKLQAQAELLLEQASLGQAKSELDLTRRAMSRAQTLSGRGVLSDVELDGARSELLAKEAAVQVAEARVKRALAQLSAAQMRLQDTQVRVLESSYANSLVVAERFLDAGQTISANTPLLRIVSLQPVTAVFHVAEQDYNSLAVGQVVQLSTDAYDQRIFKGRVARIAPVFQAGSRQARVEVSIENADQALKPGMFVRAEVVLRRVEAAWIVPADALVKRSDRQGIFLINAKGDGVVWREVEVGIRQGERVQLIADSLAGDVVTLGQQLIEDGMRVAVVRAGEPPAVE